MTVEEFQEVLENCNFASPQAVSKLISESYTTVQFDQKVLEREVKNPVGAANYFRGFFGTETIPDGQPMDRVREYFAAPHVPFSFEYFVRQMDICDPNLANRCDHDYMEIPEGGRGTLPPVRMYRWGIQTKRDCIANIREIRDFYEWAARAIAGREVMNEQLYNIFFTMAGIQTAGHKVTLQGQKDANGVLRYMNSSNPRNPMRRGLYNYMQERFPQPTDVNTLVPLTVDAMDDLARYLDLFPKGFQASKGTRGENIYEFWTGDDWYKENAINDPDMLTKLRLTMPNSMFAGWTLAPGEREVIGQFAPKIMPWLPRFAPTADGKIIPVDSHVGINIEVGQEHVGSFDFLNAPIGLAIIASGKQGTILNRPSLTKSAQGIPIQPITSDSGWVINNEYDKDCNKEKNKPFQYRNYELGFRQDDPDAAIAILYRRRVFTSKPINECDLAPIFTVTNPSISGSLAEIGCQTGYERQTNNIVGGDAYHAVSCTSVSCGNDAGPTYMYLLKIERKTGNPGFNSLECDCGDTVNLYVHDDEGVFDRIITGTIKDTNLGFPFARYFVETTSALADGECIRGISCADDTADLGNVVDSFDISEGVVGFILDSPLGDGKGSGDGIVGDTVTITYYDANNASLGTVEGEISEIDIARNYYKITSEDAAFEADGVFAGQDHVTVELA